MTWGISAADQDRTVDATRDVGARWMRLTMSWHDLEPDKGRYSGLAAYDTTIDKALTSGAKLLVTVYTAPPWASGTDKRESPPLNPADYADFMRFVADRYRGKVAAWEIWNEQNSQGFWSTGPDPARYAQLLKAAYPAVKASDPDARVVYGGTWQNDYEFLEAAYNAVPDLGQYYDVMATHPYAGTSAPEHYSLDSNGRIAKHSFAGYRELRETMLDHGDDKPIWFTEFGWATFDGEWGVSESAQADLLARAYKCVEQDPYVDVAIWYALRNHPYGGDGANWEHQLGLTRTDFSHKPSYDTFKSYTPGLSLGCTYTDPSSPPLDLPAVPDLPGVPPLPTTPDPSQIAPDRLIGTVPASTLRSPMLSVRRALVRRGRLVIDGRLARGATGVVRGVEAHSIYKSAFSAPVGPDGRFRIRQELPAGKYASSARVVLAYAKNAQFHGQWVVLDAAPRSARLKVARPADTASVSRAQTVRGTLAPEARGAVVLGLTYRTANGTARFEARRRKISGGEFAHTVRLPAGSHDATLYVVFPGDPSREIGGSSQALRLR